MHAGLSSSGGVAPVPSASGPAPVPDSTGGRPGGRARIARRAVSPAQVEGT
ncbi:hypothetical protein SCATT_44050 [Streptantibioticus cattleyicolor NRRL 8057 = DSM 46488]|uniref:Uncharacterized protein n=1 Tax=Streptantibioticus cattleyicolor (strain ATCC 35852 / DSM 46488 / JCM 4925 / NBRC 14057 / NRRL 8057) TaxID=1003195 RepID=G8WV12_STREN|nr:hypothetical protein SCATT_44050 [Streptantibioticus cattleyicolor NRRL 8057 = DSM 46488]